MQELILVISRCLSKRKSVKNKDSFYCFHFKGFYAGEKIKMIYLFPKSSEQLEKGDDYLLWVKRLRCRNEVLEVELIKFKKIL